MQFNRVLPDDAHVVDKNTFERILRESDYVEVEEGDRGISPFVVRAPVPGAHFCTARTTRAVKFAVKF